MTFSRSCLITTITKTLSHFIHAYYILGTMLKLYLIFITTLCKRRCYSYVPNKDPEFPQGLLVKATQLTQLVGREPR